MIPASRRKRDSRRGAAIYIIVLGTAMLVALLGLSALLAKRVERRLAEDASDMAEARLYAQAAIEIGQLRIENDSPWRTAFPNGVWEADQLIGGGTYTLHGVDPTDADLTDDPSDPVELTGTGVKGRATQKMRLTLVPYQAPLEALRTCLHADDKIDVLAGKTVTVTGASLSSNNKVTNDGTVDGDVECSKLEGGGTATGTTIEDAESKNVPDAGVFEMYKSMATEIPYSGDFDKHVLTPGVNTYGGGLNPDGLYYVDAGNNDLVIQGTRIHGTLVVDAKKVILEDAAFLHNYRSDYPVVIVNGDLELKLKSAEHGLDEVTWSVNFNPAGAPYEGSSDADQVDTYPNEVRGLVHVTGTLSMQQTARVQGAVICESSVTCNGANQIVHNPDFYENPPLGYLEPVVMKISPGSWCQVVGD